VTSDKIPEALRPLFTTSFLGTADPEQQKALQPVLADLLK